MKELIEKITSYNIFNFLLPGVVYVVLIKEMSSYSFTIDNNLIGLFIYYFIGLIISRVGSLVIEPIMKKTSLVKFADYNGYIKASTNDKKIELFSEVNNTYRTLISMLFLLLVVKLYELFDQWIGIPSEISHALLIIGLLILFLFSYRKQTDFIAKRVNANIKEI